MKRLFYLLLIFSAFIACDKGGEDIIPDPAPSEPEQTVVTSITARISNTTRATTIVDASNAVQSFWSKDDKLSVTDMNKIAVFNLSEGAGSVNAKFTGSLETTKTELYATYPTTTISGAKIKYTIPQQQSYTAVRGTDLKDKILMFGKSTDAKTFSFSTITAFVRFNITVPEGSVIKSVTMTTEQSGIAGDCAITLANPYIIAGDKKSLTLTYTNSPKTTTTDGWASIAPINFQTATGKILYDVATDKGDFTFCYNLDEKFEAGGVYTVKLSVLDFVQVESRDNLKHGEYYTTNGMPEQGPEPGSIAQGRITYADGSPAVGISVSDGFSVVQTNEYGKFSLTPHQDAWYIFYTIPSDCMVQINDYGMPLFYTAYSKDKFDYNFTLSKLSGGKDSQFTLFCLADPQCSSTSSRSRFTKESIPALKAHSESLDMPCYGVTLGDVVSSSSSSDTTPHLPYMREHMSKNKSGFPIFQTMGNHDFLYFNSSQPINPDETSSTYNIKAQRYFEEIFGPINYSWDRADAHIVSMRDMQWNNNTDPANYSLDFSNEQVEWLRQDLSFVPKNKLVILCVHIPLVNNSRANVQKVIKLLAQYQEAHIMAGHTHYMRNEPTLSSGVYEHVHGAVCGAWWHSNTNGDGVPNGYGVYKIVGNTIVNWHYQGVNTGQNGRDYQLRLYRGNHRSGGSIEYFAQQHGDNVLLINVFNADSNWKIKVYENDVYSGTPTLIPYKKVVPTKTSTGMDNPTLVPTNSSSDWWAVGYLVGVKNRSRDSYTTSCFHLYKYTLKDKNAKIRVEATDIFGRTYTETYVTPDYDYSLMDVR